MMYNNSLAVAIKVGGKILREFKDTVYIPYGCEYEVLIKNLNTKRVLVHMTIDGKEMLDDGLVIDPGKEVTLERSINNGNLNTGNRFKFIERSADIEAHRGIGIEDGLIVFNYQFEEYYYGGLYSGINGMWNTVYGPNPAPLYNSTLRSSGIMGIASTAAQNSVVTSQGMASSTLSGTVPTSDVGITVPGSISNQQFSTVKSFTLEATKHSMVLKILGETAENKVIREPVTVKQKPKCSSCGRNNKHNAKFCSNCGTSLIII